MNTHCFHCTRRHCRVAVHSGARFCFRLLLFHLLNSIVIASSWRKDKYKTETMNTTLHKRHVTETGQCALGDCCAIFSPMHTLHAILVLFVHSCHTYLLKTKILHTVSIGFRVLNFSVALWCNIWFACASSLRPIISVAKELHAELAKNDNDTW